VIRCIAELITTVPLIPYAYEILHLFNQIWLFLGARNDAHISLSESI